MTTETRIIGIEAYRDPDGHPTCCTNWETERCRFVSTRKFGLVEVCAATGLDIARAPAGSKPGEFVDRQEGHFLRPHAGCPVWGGSA